MSVLSLLNNFTMRVKISTIIPLVSGLVLLSGLPSQSQGQRVLGQWSDGFWYPATVQSVQGNRVRLQFDDGDVGTVTPNQVKDIYWQPGTKVQCNWKNGGTYYNGTIAQMRGNQIAVNYDDGDKEQTRIGQCRSL